MQPPLYGSIARFVRVLVAAFFRRVEVVGLEHVPYRGGAIVVSWHPNGLIDPGLIVACSPRPVIFGARHGLFRWPVLGQLMVGAGAVPIYRSVDLKATSPEERKAANRKSLDALAQAVADGGISCLFPEGTSHDAPHLKSLKTGVARLYYRAQELAPDAPPPVILPVGLHYDAKRRYRSNALVSFHPPLELGPELAGPRDLPEEDQRRRERELTSEVNRALRQVVRATESWELHHQLHRASKLLRAERAHLAGAELDTPGVLEWQVGFSRIWAGYYRQLDIDPDGVGALMARIGEYDADLRALRIEDDDLDRAPARARALGLLALIGQLAAVYLLMPALLIGGAVINIGPYLALRVGAKLASRQHKDVATIKVLVGTALYPAAWITAGVLAAQASYALHEQYPVVPARPLLAAFVVMLLGVIGGMVALRYVRLVGETVRAARVRLTRARRRVALARLRVERSELAEELEALERGLDLPGSVTAEGEVIASEVVPPGGKA